MKTLSSMMQAVVERLAEMLPESTYQSRLEEYLSRHHIDNPVQLEQLQRQYDYDRTRGFL
jgi:hypothetical protein